jgi:hypothetical protein
MKIAHVLSSTAKFEVLNILFKDPSPLRVRALERRTGLAVRSVQVALDNLVKAKVVTRKIQNNSPVYFLNKSHESYVLINNIFKAVELEWISKRSDSYHSKAKKAFKFVSEASELFQRARS